VCTGHCTVQCPKHRQSRAQNPFSCALSGVHRTGTVDCPVRPYPVFKKTFPLSRPWPGGSSSLSALALCLWRSSPLRRRPPCVHRLRSCSGDLRPPALIPSPSGEKPCLHPPSLFSLFNSMRSPPPLCAHLKFL
jgi:hypothetical protein